MRDPELRAFADRVNQLREAQGLSWKELAVRVGSTSSALRRWKSGSSWPRTETVVALSKALGVTTDYLLLGRGPAPDPTRFSALKRAIEETPRRLREALCHALLGEANLAPFAAKRPANDSYPQPERKT
jgi:transcriptional regulator with XRE-family HTH domain